MNKDTERLDPLARLPDEPDRWFDRYERFRLLGPQRTVTAAWRSEDPEANANNSVPPHWYETSRKYRWRERAGAWDDEQREKMREAESLALEQRRAAWLELETRASNAMIKKALDMLEFPLAEERTVDEETGEVVVAAPAGWRMRDAATLLDKASKIARLGMGLKTDDQRVDVVSDADIRAQLEAERERYGRLTSDPTEEED